MAFWPITSSFSVEQTLIPMDIAAIKKQYIFQMKWSLILIYYTASSYDKELKKPIRLMKNIFGKHYIK